ncbi:hypothetical protein C8R43DRAFT_836878, partial [Mycena crocata]
MIIARVKSVMQVRWTRGRQLCYKDHIINFRQDIINIAQALPRLPQDIDMIIIRREGVNLEGHIDFTVRREKVREALEYKIAHDPMYFDLTLDLDALAALPENGSVAHLIPMCREGRQDGQDVVDPAAAMPAGPSDAAAAPGIDEDGDEAFLAGMLDVGGGVREEIHAPPLNPDPINESTPGYMALAFPTLFPDGKGDFHNIRTIKVEFGEYMTHLMRYQGGRFARHRRFPWFAFNTLQRQRTHSQAKIFERGSGHVHGFLWVKDAPNVDDIDWNLLKGDLPLPEDQQQRMDAFTNYWKGIISAMNPFPREDENVPLVGKHPCNQERAALKHTKEELSEILNWVERHTKCMPGYCQVKRKFPGEQEPRLTCRFDYPMELREEAGIGFDSKKRVRFEPARNDRLLNTYNRAMILAWRANIDVKPVMSTAAAQNYIAKYASKSEQQAPAFPQLLSTIVNQMDGAGTAKSACQKLLNKMLGERTYSAQETAHLPGALGIAPGVLLGIPLVRTSVSFQTLNLSAEGGVRELQAEEADDVDEPAERPVTGNSWFQRYMQRAPELEELSMHDVFRNYTWVKTQWRKRRASSDVILRTFPRISPNPDGDQYEAYCRTKILLHHPYRDLAALKRLDGEDVTWEELWALCRTAEHGHPKDTLRCWETENRTPQEEADDDDDVPNPDAAPHQDDWQVFAE